MILKIAVGAAAVATGTFSGILKSMRLSGRRKLLENIITGLEFLENEIFYTRERLDMIASRVSRMVEGDASDFFLSFAAMLQSMGEKSTDEIWNMAVEKNFSRYSPLCSRDVEAIASLGARLGKTDVKDQCENIKRTCRELSLIHAEAQKDVEEKGRLYRTAGIAAGIACAVMIL